MAGPGAVAQLPAVTSTHAWRKDHNGFSHQGPGFIDKVVNKKRRGRAGLPAAGRQLPAVGGRPLPRSSRLRQRHRRRQATELPDWLTTEDADAHCARGSGVWAWAGTDDGTAEPDIVLACSGDVLTLETRGRRRDPAAAAAAPVRCGWSTWST